MGNKDSAADVVLSVLTSYCVNSPGTNLRRDTLIPQWFQVSKATAARDGYAMHFRVTAVIFPLSRLKWIPKISVTNMFLGGLAILCGRNGRRARGKPGHLRAYCLGYFHIPHTP